MCKKKTSFGKFQKVFKNILDLKQLEEQTKKLKQKKKHEKKNLGLSLVTVLLY